MIAYDLKTMQRCKIEGNTVVALGMFDGCHVGHASVLRNAFYTAKAVGARSLAYIFDTLGKKNAEAVLTLEERIKCIRAFDIDYLVVDDFDRVRDMDGEAFFSQVLRTELNAISASCGYNYRFGKNASCSHKDLTEFFEKVGGSVQISEEITVNGKPVSSTLIRSLIKEGHVEDILDYMRPYSIYAQVLHGKGMGKGMGFATVNQEIPQGKIVPLTGVYVTECEIGEDVYPSVTNVGYRPTTDGENSRLNVETHIIGYTGELYHSFLRVNFYKYLREEKRFDSLDELVAQVESDKRHALDYFGYKKGQL